MKKCGEDFTALSKGSGQLDPTRRSKIKTILEIANWTPMALCSTRLTFVIEDIRERVSSVDYRYDFTRLSRRSQIPRAIFRLDVRLLHDSRYIHSYSGTVGNFAIIRCLDDCYNSGNGLCHHRRTKAAYVTSTSFPTIPPLAPILASQYRSDIT